MPALGNGNEIPCIYIDNPDTTIPVATGGTGHLLR